MYARRPATTDMGFFSKSFSLHSASVPPPVTPATKVVVKTRIVQRTGAVKVVARDATPATASSSRASSIAATEPRQKRKSTSPVVFQTKKSHLSTSPLASRKASATPSETSSIRSQPLGLSWKRKATSHTSSEAPQAKKSRHSSSVAEYRATSATPPRVPSTETPSVAQSRNESPVPATPRARWTNAAARLESDLLTCEVIVRNMVKDYKAFFKNPKDPKDTSFEPHPTNYPVVELEYPNTSASERFILLRPRDKDHYNPIICLQKTLHTIVEHYLTPEQKTLFGPIPDTSLSHILDDTECDSSPDSVAMTGADGPQTSSLLSTMLSSSSLLPPFLPATSSSTVLTFNFPRLLQRALNQRDGPQFLQVMDGINAFLRALKYPRLSSDMFDQTPANGLIQTARLASTVPQNVLMRIVDETYQRAVGPQVDSLKKYQAFTAETYGELTPLFVSQLIRETGLDEGSLFMDMGSGVGNVVLQASLETGCKSFGVELLKTPAEIAQTNLEQLTMRCKMWGVHLGDVELEHGDMLKSRKVDALLSKADVVLVNNKVFDEPLNEAIKGKLLDLKEGAIVISLRRFSPAKSSVTERNVDDISNIFQTTERQFPSGGVSWTGNSGNYYIHKVDRAAYALSRTQYESSRASSVRSSRSRR